MILAARRKCAAAVVWRICLCDSGLICAALWHDGRDGTVRRFAANGVVNVPLSWPGRYSHSPVEVADLRDIEALVQLIVTLAVQ